MREKRLVKKLILSVASLLCFLVSIAACAKPEKIASINLCTDQLLLMIAQRDSIVSVSHLADQYLNSYQWKRAQGIALNNGLAEELISLEPDLVLASSYTDPSIIALMQRFGLNVEVIPIPKNWQEVVDGLRTVGQLAGEDARAEEIIAEMQLRWQAIIERDKTSMPLAVLLAPNGFTSGLGTFKNFIFEAAGFRNLAAEIGLNGYGYLHLETLVKHNPSYIFIEDAAEDHQSLGQKMLNHPALVKGLLHRKIIPITTNLWSCAGPSMVDAAQELIDAL